MRAFIIQITLLTFAFMAVLALLRVRFALEFWRRARLIGYAYVAVVVIAAVIHYLTWLD